MHDTDIRTGGPIDRYLWDLYARYADGDRRHDRDLHPGACQSGP